MDETEGAVMDEMVAEPTTGGSADAAPPAAGGPSPVASAAAPTISPAAQGPTGQLDPAAAISKMIEEEFGAPKKPEGAEEEEPPQGLAPDATQRFHKLASERREAMQAATQMQQQLQQATQYIGQVRQWAQENVAAAQKQNHEMAVQLAELKGQIAVMQRGQEPENVDPATRLRDEWLAKMEASVKERLVGPLQQKLEAFEQARAQEQEQANVSRLSNEYRQAADLQAQNYVLKGFEPDVAKALQKDVGAFIIAHQMHNDSTPEQAARWVRGAMLRYAQALYAQIGKPAHPTAGATKLPQSRMTGRRVSTAGGGLPSIKDIQAAGFDNELDANFMARQQ